MNNRRSFLKSIVAVAGGATIVPAAVKAGTTEVNVNRKKVPQSEPVFGQEDFKARTGIQDPVRLLITRQLDAGFQLPVLSDFPNKPLISLKDSRGVILDRGLTVSLPKPDPSIYFGWAQIGVVVTGDSLPLINVKLDGFTNMDLLEMFALSWRTTDHAYSVKEARLVKLEINPGKGTTKARFAAMVFKHPFRVTAVASEILSGE